MGGRRCCTELGAMVLIHSDPMPHPRHSPALVLCLVLLACAGSPALADPPEGTAGGTASSSSQSHGGFLSSLKQAFGENVDREVVWAHFDVGSAPETHRFYCLVDPKTGKREPNGVAGQPFTRHDGMTGLKAPAISPVSCSDAEQKGILVTSGYTVSMAPHGATSSVPPAAATPAPIPHAAAAPAVTAASAAAPPPHGSDLRAQMEAANASFLNAYNSQSRTALKGIYTPDAMLLPPSSQPLVGADAIGTFWADSIKDGKRTNPTLQIVSVWAEGRYAYQVARYTVDMVDGQGATSKVAGNAVRIFEKQPDGKWLTKVHIFNSD
jgi:ketosteroid isomerase-like protein